jgi:AcrR family transcriptional regulator
MRYSSTHKEESRRRLLEASGAIAKRGGFATTGVDGLMAAIGLTGGAFYGHFPSKQALFAAVIERELERSVRLFTPDGSTDRRADLIRSLRRYLNLDHVHEPEAGCAIPALGAEIARAEPAVRETVETGMRAVHALWTDKLEDPEAAWAVIAQCVGAIVLARTMATPETQAAVIDASLAFLIDRLEPPAGQPGPAGSST